MINNAVANHYETPGCCILHLGHMSGYGVALMIGLVR